MCDQQDTATNKLCYLEAWTANAELRHEPRRNQVGEQMVLCLFAVISTSPPSCTSFAVPIISRNTQFSFTNFPAISYSVKTNLNSGGAVSRLYVANANRFDSGNYTCSLGESAKTTIAVHVLNGRWS
jgi:hypothetical protein